MAIVDKDLTPKNSEITTDEAAGLLKKAGLFKGLSNMPTLVEENIEVIEDLTIPTPRLASKQYDR